MTTGCSSKRGRGWKASTRQSVAELLLALLLCCFQSGQVHATQLPAHLRQQMQTRIRHHMQQATQQTQGPSLLQPMRPSRMLATAPAPIRILPDYQLPSSLSDSTATTIRAVVTAAIQTLQEYVQVRAPTGPAGLLVVPQYVSVARCQDVTRNPQSYGGETCSGPGYAPSFSPGVSTTDIKYPRCGLATVNPAHMLSEGCVRWSGSSAAISCGTSSTGATGGAQTDMYLYVTSDRSSCPSNVAAFALPCLYDLSTNRPVMGALNLCPVAVSGFTTDKLVATVVHEITHALGFTNDLFPAYVDPNTNQVLGASQIMATVGPPTSAGTRGSYAMVVSPTVQREVRLQFNCPTLAGAALEDQGGSGSANSHWEYELFQGELMTPTQPADNGNQRYSRLTLALLEDSGWYLGNWSAAPYLDWGRAAGCALPQQTCSYYSANTQGQPYFCPNSQSTSDACTFNGQSHGYCTLNPTFATCGIVNTLLASGTSSPSVIEPSCLSPYYYNAGLTNEAAGKAAFGWSIGASSRCLVTSLPLRSSTPSLLLTSTLGQPSLGVCWTAACSTNGALTYNIAGQSVPCPVGQSIVLSSLSSTIQQGTVTCPTSDMQAAAMCRTLQCPSSGCVNPGGNCFEGACVCRLGSAGADCSQDLVAAALGSPATYTSPATSAGQAETNSGGPGNPAGSLGAPPGGQPGSKAVLTGTSLVIVIVVASVVGIVIIAAIVAIMVVALRSSSGDGYGPQAAAMNGGAKPPAGAGAGGELAGYAGFGGQAGLAPPPINPVYGYSLPLYPSAAYNAPPPSNMYHAQQPYETGSYQSQRYAQQF